MSRTTGPILAVGAIALVNESVFADKPVDWRIPVATGFAAMGFSMFERVMPDVALVLAWGGVIALLMTRTDPGIPSPVENFQRWWNEGGK
ncbi:hypothetical protein [Streptomyces sp. NPDC056264]|uniref:hypothetical protein n=1 Tax=Streptomyces sp. NPDC056264 TaxID=3345767 RepID=UPI003AAE7BD9